MPRKRKPTIKLDPREVVQYLANHPELLDRYEEVLERPELQAALEELGNLGIETYRGALTAYHAEELAAGLKPNVEVPDRVSPGAFSGIVAAMRPQISASLAEAVSDAP